MLTATATCAEPGVRIERTGRSPEPETTMEPCPALPARLPPRILVADDDDEVRELVAEALRAWGYEVTEARDGAELLDHASWSIAGAGAVRAVDLVVTDVNMPGLSGLEALAEIRRLDPAVRAIVMTGVGGQDVEAEAARLGAAAVFDKPFLLDNLLIAVTALLPPPATTR